MRRRKKRTFLDLYEQIKEKEDFLLEKLTLNIIEEIIEAMQLRKVDRAELARRLETSRAYVTKLFNTDINLTLRSLIKITRALGMEISVHLHEQKTQAIWFDVYKQPRAGLPDRPTVPRSGYKQIEEIPLRGAKDEQCALTA